MMRTRVIKTFKKNLTAKLAVIALNVFIFNILPAADFKTPNSTSYPVTRAPFDLSRATYTPTQRF